MAEAARPRARSGATAVLVALVALPVLWCVWLAAALVGTEVHLAGARAALTQSDRRLAAVDRDTARAGRSREAATMSLAAAQGELASTSSDLADSNGSLGAQSLDLGSLHTCLSGVGATYQALSAGQLPGAVHALDGASAACLAVEGAGSSGLVYPYDFPDPDVIKVAGTYYAYATNSAAGNIQVIESPDLVEWTPVGNALTQGPPGATPGSVWAPDVLEVGRTFVMYFAAAIAPSGEECIFVATAPAAAGPFVGEAGPPLVCQEDLGGSIDPSTFVDTDGTVYLDWRSIGGDGQPATIWAQQLSPDATALAGSGPTALLTSSDAWEDGVVEGPDMTWLGGQRVLFFAGNNWQTPNYAIGVADCAGPLGPCTEPAGQPIFSSNGDVVGPGGPAVFTGPHGQPELAFAAWLPNEVGFPHSRVLFIRPLGLANGVPVVCPPAGSGACP